jgi:hypothetical protein
MIEIGEFTGRAERRQPVNAGLDEIVAQTAKHIGANLPAGVNRRDQVGKNAVEIMHARGLLPNTRQGRNREKALPRNRHFGRRR